MRVSLFIVCGLLMVGCKDTSHLELLEKKSEIEAHKQKIEKLEKELSEIDSMYNELRTLHDNRIKNFHNEIDSLTSETQNEWIRNRELNDTIKRLKAEIKGWEIGNIEFVDGKPHYLSDDEYEELDKIFWDEKKDVYENSTYRYLLKGSTEPYFGHFVKQFLDLYSDMLKPLDDIVAGTGFDEVTPDTADIEKKCTNASRIKSIYKVRQKVWFLHRALVVEISEDEIRKEYYRNRSYLPLVHLMRDEQSLKDFSKMVKIHFDENFDKKKFLKKEWRIFAEELVGYHHMITSTKDWKRKFAILYAQREERNLGNSAHFYEIGFPQHENRCMDETFSKDSNYLAGYDLGVEGWMYGFWLRRYKEGTMTELYNLLTWILE